MKIGLDAMGGDFAPEAAVKGAILAQKQLLPTERIVLFGDKEKIESIIEAEKANPSDFDIEIGRAHV